MNHQGIVDTAVISGDPHSYITSLTSRLSKSGIMLSLITSLDQILNVQTTETIRTIILDIEGLEKSQVTLLPSILSRSNGIQVLVLIDENSMELGTLAIKLGARALLHKRTPDLAEQIVSRITKHNEASPHHLPGTPIDLGIIGSSQAMREVFNQIELICHTDVNVLILGESGTGKEIIARALHQLSNRRQHSFEAINCAAIPDNLLESELFGHKKGAFTDARRDRQGLFELSSQGTLFLDEIGEISPMTQVKLLRVLQEREIRPLGSNRTIKVNTRVIAATNRNLESQITKGEFREDLYFRLAVIPIHLPPLRDRKEDIPSLIRHFLEFYNKRYQLNVMMPPDHVFASLSAYHWPGNIRELQNVIERGVIMSRNNQLNLDHFTKTSAYAAKLNIEAMTSLNYATAKQDFEKRYILKLLEATRGNIAEAARVSGKFRTDIYRMMERYQIDAQMFKILGFEAKNGAPSMSGSNLHEPKDKILV